MIIFSLIDFFSVKSSFVFFIFLTPLCVFPRFRCLVCSLSFFISFVCLFFFPYFFCWSGLGYIFRCDLISYGLIFLSLWICVLMVLARESIFHLGYFSVFFSFYCYCSYYCTLRRIFFFFESGLIPTLFLILGWGYQPARVQAGIYLLFYMLLASLPLQ
jgi:NADH-ubiquinone oxidoreductase chain 4